MFCWARIKLVEAPCTSLDELMFDCIVCVMQRPKRRAEDLVSSRQPVFVFLFLLLLTFLHFLFQPEHLEVTWIFDAMMMRSALEHCIVKALSGCYHERPGHGVYHLCLSTGLSLMYICLHTHMRTHNHTFQDHHIWLVLSCLLLVFSLRQCIYVRMCVHESGVCLVSFVRRRCIYVRMCVHESGVCLVSFLANAASMCVCMNQAYA